MKLKPYICECCGGVINRASYICEYCGTRYEELNGVPYIVEVNNNRCKVITVQAELPDELCRQAGKDTATNLTMNKIRYKLAEALEDNLNLELEYEPRLMRHIITAKLRVVDPRYRF